MPFESPIAGVGGPRPSTGGVALPGLQAILTRLTFASRFRTLRKLATDARGELHACGRRGIHAVPARCPHQGAALARGWVEGDELVCHWHGCRYHLTERVWRRAGGGESGTAP